MTTMNAVRLHEYGGPEVLTYERIDRPVAKGDELLVRVHGIGINPIDWKLREGYAKERIPLSLPAILGTDISGVIEQVGHEVNGFRPGDAVFAMLGLFGAYAEYVAVKPALVAPKPARLSHLQAASVPLAALTAWQGLFDHAELASGQSVLVHAAAGGVGSFAVQFAHHKGAHVIATASVANEDYVRQLGAKQIIDYRSQPFEQQVDGVDVVLDLVGGETTARSLAVLKPGGVLVQVVPGPTSVAEKAAAMNVRAVTMQTRPDGSQLREIAALIDSAGVGTSIASVFALEEIGAAHELSKTGRTRGKIVVDCNGHSAES